MTDQASIQAKFARARTHLESLSGSVQVYAKSDPIAAQEEEDIATGDLVYRVRYRLEPPTHEWSLLAGDAIHNARSALDHLAWALVIRDGGQPTSRTQFPIAEDDVKGRRAINGDNLHGVAKETREIVRSMKPWQGGDDKLWQLHRLDIVDKHRLLLRAGVANRGVRMTFPGFPTNNPETGEAIESPVFELRPDDASFPLSDGDEVFRVLRAARATPEADSAIRQSLRGLKLDVGLADGEAIDGESLVPRLMDLVTHAESVITPLLALLSE